MIEFDASGLDSASLRSAGKELLSLALIDARNHTLRWASALEAAADGAALALPADLPAPLAAELDPVLWTLGHVAWFQEHWIARNVQRAIQCSWNCLLYTSPSPRDPKTSRMPSSA